ncbi:uncharacterized protein BHQ10_001966 [Talaromyces amestolkiae]|uniref:Uncharacterized protein n=1 Tax=Talaromyces amestolkiae TaxID=1196081 RepID=A0A364KQX6_TALAM|nr:uncharacterized protein BHQ10_001966 [Talaromyces amestolkiae]RAO65954.1 hypothetical protein BHQ10_001966 [Talaromyces amestolkiae]
MEKRDPTKPAVDMQEAAQVVPWIKGYPSKGRLRMTLAQAGQEMYIIISKYSDNYLEYINDNQPTADFMTMTQYGSYSIDSA